jgi:glutamate-ammonia-ligase adenylyltransferase
MTEVSPAPQPVPATVPVTPPITASRFVARWLGAAPERAEQLASLSAVSLADADFRVLLEGELAKGLPLERAMRRVRNLLISTIVARDLGGQADLDEVVTAMTAFADFAIQTHVASLMAELVAAHGMPASRVVANSMCRRTST